ncbi:hypothetical protein I4F81_002522 [Pyropia yezoensis]|uniref:Uncharacterized protein n=1 Tax=Pyropia yezoensis TaxID=2788 RepID=A0ACC3BPT9_PYRYE|nr:hypothetical protein I4F81_002522 [Neopyropia yezoensis]
MLPVRKDVLPPSSVPGCTPPQLAKSSLSSPPIAPGGGGGVGLPGSAPATQRVARVSPPPDFYACPPAHPGDGCVPPSPLPLPAIHASPSPPPSFCFPHPLSCFSRLRSLGVPATERTPGPSPPPPPAAAAAARVPAAQRGDTPPTAAVTQGPPSAIDTEGVWPCITTAAATATAARAGKGGATVAVGNTDRPPRRWRWQRQRRRRRPRPAAHFSSPAFPRDSSRGARPPAVR